MSKKILVGVRFLTRKTAEIVKRKILLPPRLDLGTFCVLGRCDNQYTMASMSFYRFQDSESVVKWHLLGVFIVATLFAKEKVVFIKIRG